MTLSHWSFWSQVVVQRLTLALLLLLAVGGLLWSAAAAAGVAPWLELPARLGGQPVDAGPAVQLALTALLVGLCFFVPSNDRVMRLETSHRSFRVTMWDVARAYQSAHAADREGTFRLPSEFDSVRERIEFLRRHPDLGKLEPEVLEMAAQMSHESRELAEIYSGERVERARAFLRQRQEEAEEMQARVEGALAACREIRRWLERVETDEDTARTEMARLKAELADLLPGLGLRLFETATANVELLGRRTVAAE
jgi:hypothetical protein